MADISVERIEEMIAATQGYIDEREKPVPVDMVEADNATESLNIAGEKWFEETSDPDEFLLVLKWARAGLATAMGMSLEECPSDA